MRVLLDENLPLDLAPELLGHDVQTVVGLAWQGVKNGELLRRTAGVSMLSSRWIATLSFNSLSLSRSLG